jgi:hypothetical protein
MKYLWLLLPFVGLWVAAYIFGLMSEVGYQWWTIPTIITVFITWMALLYQGCTNAGIE